MKAGSVFAGFGGFELGLLRADFEILWSIEKDPFCCKVLRKNFTHKIIECDVRKCGKSRQIELESVDLLVGGWPCQPVSLAGNRGGQTDDRWLWPEYFRLVTELRPTWCIGENVAGIYSMDEQARFSVLEDEEVASQKVRPILSKIRQDFEKIGYRVLFFDIPAAAIGADHLRHRYWPVAYSNGCDAGLLTGALQREIEEKRIRQSESICVSGRTGEAYDSDRNSQQFDRSGETWRRRSEGSDRREDDRDHNGPRFPKWESIPEDARKEFQALVRTDWQSWVEAATAFCRVDDGLPAELHKLAHADRTNRLKGLGNAVHPEIPRIIGTYIKAIHEQLNQ